MFLSNASIRRPVAMCCLIIGLTLLGLNAYRKMNLEYLPKVDLPYITVLTIYPGGSPAEIETDIAKRIEDVVVSVDGIEDVISACMENVCQTLLEFELEVDVDVAANDVREKLDLIVNDFPSGAEKPKVIKYDVNAKPVINLALTGDAPLDELFDYADNTLRDRLTVVTGVAEVQLIGGAEREVHVVLDRDKLAARGLTSMHAVQAIQEGVRLIPSGRVREAGIEYAVKFDADFAEVPDIGFLEIANADGQRCYIKDIGRVEMTTEELRQTSFIDGRPCIGVKVIKRAEANAVQVVERIEAVMDEIQRLLPGGMELVWVTDDASFIRASVDATVSNIWQGIVLTGLILFFFLYNFRTTLIVAATMPLTIVIGLFFMGFLEYTLNISTLMAMGLSIGILVTNSIVVLESIVKNFSETGDAVQASRIGARQVAIAVIASAGTNLVVLFPVAMMGSQVGLFFKPFALTMAIMTVVSLFISFSLTPLLCAVLLKPAKPGARSPIAAMERIWNRGFESVSKAFAGVLRFFEGRRWAAMFFLAVVILTFFWSLRIAGKVGFDFFPEADRGEVFVKLEFPTYYDLERTVNRVREAEARLKSIPSLRHIFTTVGKVEGVIGRSTEGVYLAQILLKLSEKTERATSIDDLLEKSRTVMQDYPDCIVSVTQPSGIGGQSTPIEMEIDGESFDELDRLVLVAQQCVRELPGMIDPDTTVRMGKPELRVRPRRPVLADLAIPATSMGLALRANLEGLDAGTFKRAGRNYDIVVKLDEVPGKNQVQEFLFPGAPGRPMLLSNVGAVEEGKSPVQITRRNKRRVSKLFADLEGNKPLGTAVTELSALLDERLGLPAGYGYSFHGEYEIMEEGNAAMAEAGLIALILVYLVLAAILESFKQPFVILLTIPLGLIGILWALGITGQAISMFVLLGSVMLIGIVVNNAILIMDQLNQHIIEGVPRHEAMVTAASERLRPIIMITLAAILGMLPLAIGRGIGSEIRTAIGIASVGGIAVSAVLTLVVLPIVYDLFTRAKSPRPAKEAAPGNTTTT